MLNLDSVKKPLGEFTVSGQSYKVWPLTVGQLINLSAMPEAEVGSLKVLIEILHDSVPECPIEVLRGLDMTQLNLLSAWIQGSAGEDAEKNSPPLLTPEPAAVPANGQTVETISPALL